MHINAPKKKNPPGKLVGEWVWVYLDDKPEAVGARITRVYPQEGITNPATGRPYMDDSGRLLDPATGEPLPPRTYVEATAFPPGKAPRPVSFVLEEHAVPQAARPPSPPPRPSAN